MTLFYLSTKEMDTESGLETWSGRIGTNFRNTVPASNFIAPSIPGFKELTVFLELTYIHGK